MKKTIKVKPETHRKLEMYRVNNSLRTQDQAISLAVTKAKKNSQRKR